MATKKAAPKKAAVKQSRSAPVTAPEVDSLVQGAIALNPAGDLCIKVGNYLVPIGEVVDSHTDGEVTTLRIAFKVKAATTPTANAANYAAVVSRLTALQNFLQLRVVAMDEGCITCCNNGG